MNIRLIHSVIRRPAAKLLAIAATAAMTALGGPVATAQSGLVGYLADDVQPTDVTVQESPADWGSPFAAGTKILPASAVRTAADVPPGRLAPGSITHAVGNTSGTAKGSVAQVNYGCQSCMQSACNGGCNSYGATGYGSANYGGSMACGVPCSPYRYVILEGLYMDREGINNRSLIRNTPLGDDNFEFLPRVTVGSLPNCVSGWEITYVGDTTWDRSVTAVDPNGNLQSLISAGPNFDATFLDPFTDSNIQTVAHSSEYWSLEINKTVVGWDVAKVLFGGRYISIEDRFVYAAQKDIFSSYADLSSRTRNDLFGVQGGLDLLYPITRNLYTDFRGRLGLMLDLADTEVRLRNQGQTIVRNFSDDTAIGGVFEIAGGLRYQLGEALSIKAGGELWYLTDFASGDDQIRQVIRADIGSRTETRDVFYYGITVGGEFRF